jgi:trehalose 6-phosphate synthase/phosphatase
MAKRKPERDARAHRSLVVVSNRLPITFKMGQRGIEGHRSSGGLVSALDPVLQERGGKWVGWAGAQVPRDAQLGRKEDSYEMQAVALTDAEVTRYYHGFSNRTLWPLFHSFPSLARFHRQDYLVYEKVNRKFAAVTAAAAGPDSLVWIHDYHLLLAPQIIREALPEARLAFFLHIPFPAYDICRLLPWSRELLRGMLACDLIGFHVDHYTRNFLDCVELLLRGRVDRAAGLVEYGGRTVQVGAYPIGIDFDSYERMAHEAPQTDATRGEKLVLGVDRLDYTKGIPERILAFERLLELHPEHRERVVFLQLAVPSRSQVAAYSELKRQIDELIGRVNGRFSTASWSPIRYLYQSLPAERLAGLYRDADVAYITPGRDGMNLVSKEFVACQTGDPGVLVLSRLAGAAETMPEAILINPYDLDRTANALHRALTMDESERRSRMTALRRRERHYDVSWWVERFLKAAQRPGAVLGQPTRQDFESWLASDLADHPLALFVDYDGALAPSADAAGQTVPDALHRRALGACARRRDIDVTVFSSRSCAELHELIADPRVTCAGNHGLEIEGPGLPRFVHPELPHHRDRLQSLARELGRLTSAGARLEERGHTLLLDYGAVATARRGHVADRARTLIGRAGFRARDQPQGIEVLPPLAWNEGHAVHHIARERYGPNWSEKVRILYVGGDTPNDDIFRMLRGLGITIRVGEADTLTAATRQIPDSAAVVTLLDWLARRRRSV